MYYVNRQTVFFFSLLSSWGLDDLLALASLCLGQLHTDLKHHCNLLWSYLVVSPWRNLFFFSFSRYFCLLSTGTTSWQRWHIWLSVMHILQQEVKGKGRETRNRSSALLFKEWIWWKHFQFPFDPSPLVLKKKKCTIWYISNRAAGYFIQRAPLLMLCYSFLSVLRKLSVVGRVSRIRRSRWKTIFGTFWPLSGSMVNDICSMCSMETSSLF